MVVDVKDVVATTATLRFRKGENMFDASSDTSSSSDEKISFDPSVAFERYFRDNDDNGGELPLSPSLVYAIDLSRLSLMLPLNCLVLV